MQFLQAAKGKTRSTANQHTTRADTCPDSMRLYPGYSKWPLRQLLREKSTMYFSTSRRILDVSRKRCISHAKHPQPASSSRVERGTIIGISSILCCRQGGQGPSARGPNTCRLLQQLNVSSIRLGNGDEPKHIIHGHEEDHVRPCQSSCTRAG